MTGFKRFAYVIGGLATLAFGTPALAAGDAAADEAAIRSLNQTWIKSYNAGDAKTIIGLYAENAVLMAPGAPAASGSAAIRDYFVRDVAEVKKAGLVFSVLGKTEVGVSGDLAWESGAYLAKDKAGATVDKGKFLSVSRKKDGKWFMFRDIWNSDGPIAAAAPPTPPKK